MSYGIDTGSFTADIRSVVVINASSPLFSVERAPPVVRYVNTRNTRSPGTRPPTSRAAGLTPTSTAKATSKTGSSATGYHSLEIPASAAMSSSGQLNSPSMSH